MNLNVSQGEAGLYRHIAATTGELDNEKWDIVDLAKLWIGEVEVELCLLEAGAVRHAHRVLCDVCWFFRPKGQAWWWLTAALLASMTAWAYLPR